MVLDLYISISLNQQLSCAVDGAEDAHQEGSESFRVLDVEVSS